MEAALDRFLGTYLLSGDLTVRYASGREIRYGDATAPRAVIRFTREAWQRRIVIDPELAVGEAYVEGGLVVEKGSIADALQILMRAAMAGRPGTSRLIEGVRGASRRLAQLNGRTRAARNVAHHYDLDRRFYALFLDTDLQYSCAYYPRPDLSIDEAQQLKKRHLAAKLVLAQEGLSVLDIGSGFGGLAIYLGAVAGADVTGITLSREQLEVAVSRAGEQGLAGRVRFALGDYRDMTGCFDRVISVGMLEHVGVNAYGAFFRSVARLLADDGVAVIHSIGRSEGPSHTNRWIEKYVFPGGYVPALSEVLRAVERSGLLVTDIEILRLHYAETLAAWRARFMARQEEARRLTDDRFCRLWEFYLAGAEMGFREQNLMVFQLQLAKRQGIVPIVRDHVRVEEERLARLEAALPAPLRLAGE